MIVDGVKLIFKIIENFFKKFLIGELFFLGFGKIVLVLCVDGLVFIVSVGDLVFIGGVGGFVYNMIFNNESGNN